MNQSLSSIAMSANMLDLYHPRQHLNSKVETCSKNQQEQQQKYNSNNQEALTTINLAECSLPGMLQITPSSPPSTSPLINDIRPAIFEETYKESSSMSNFAKNLVFKLFNSQELQGSNCSGMKGKKSLEKDHRMSLIKEAVFKKYPVEDKKSHGRCVEKLSIL
jgi:hypothetical protein